MRDAGRRGALGDRHDGHLHGMTERDPAKPTPEELREHARSEGLMATEEETDPAFRDEPRAGDAPGTANPPSPDDATPPDEEPPPTGQPPVGGG